MVNSIKTPEEIIKQYPYLGPFLSSSQGFETAVKLINEYHYQFINISMKRFYRELPIEIRDILTISKGCLVGSSISKIINNHEITDYDIIVEQQNYNASYAYLRQHTISFNNFGGLSVTINNIKIDLWVQDLASFILTANHFEYAYNFTKNKLIKIQ